MESNLEKSTLSLVGGHAKPFQLPETGLVEKTKKDEEQSLTMPSALQQALEVLGCLEKMFLAQPVWQTDSTGGFATWEERVTPQGLSYTQLVHVERITSVTESFFWGSTPVGVDGSMLTLRFRLLCEEASRVGQPTFFPNPIYQELRMGFPPNWTLTVLSSWGTQSRPRKSIPCSDVSNLSMTA
jgi:hypothetical protein